MAWNKKSTGHRTENVKEVLELCLFGAQAQTEAADRGLREKRDNGGPKFSGGFFGAFLKLVTIMLW